MTPNTTRTGREHPRKALIVAIALVAALVALPMTFRPAAAHDGDDHVYVYNPITDDDSAHDDVSAWWPWGEEVAPPSHHCVYTNWGYGADFCMDVFAKASGKRIVTPFGSTTNTGHEVASTVVDVAPGCASGDPADGGYRLTVEATDTATGNVLGRAVLMHVDQPQVAAGQRVDGWTTLGFTSSFRSSSCYQVSTDAGIHVHVEFTNLHGYACWYPMSYDAELTELTRIGVVGAHYESERASC